MNNFDLKKFLVENKLTSNSRVEESHDESYWALNDDQEVVDTLNAIAEKYGLETVIQWLEDGK